MYAISTGQKFQQSTNFWRRFFVSQTFPRYIWFYFLINSIQQGKVWFLKPKRLLLLLSSIDCFYLFINLVNFLRKFFKRCKLSGLIVYRKAENGGTRQTERIFNAVHGPSGFRTLVNFHSALDGVMKGDALLKGKLELLLGMKLIWYICPLCPSVRPGEKFFLLHQANSSHRQQIYCKIVTWI